MEVTECEVLTAENFNEAVLQRPEILIPYLASFFERLRTANDRLRMEMRLRAQAEQRASAPAASNPAAAVARVVAPVAKPIAPPSLEMTRVVAPAPVATAPSAAPVAPPPEGGYQSIVLTACNDHEKFI